MKETSTKFKTVDEYISAFPRDVQQLLEQMRSAIKAAAPKATEVISYNMPAIKQDRVLVYYAAYKHHIGFYPAASGIEHFQKEFSSFKWSKGAVQFPLEKPIPLSLVTKIVKFRLKDDAERAKSKMPQR